MKIINRYYTEDYRPQSDFPESNVQPDQAYTIKELLNRYAQGLPIPDFYKPTFEGDFDDDLTDGEDLFDNIESMDFADIWELQRAAQMNAQRSLERDIEENKKKSNEEKKETTEEN